jgi:hypothetical protein
MENEDKPLEILLVEDDNDFSSIAKEVLESKGCKVYVTTNFKDAVYAMSQKNYDYYVIDGIFPYSAEEKEIEDKQVAGEFEKIYNSVIESGKTIRIPFEDVISIFEGIAPITMPYGAVIAKRLKEQQKKYILASQGALAGGGSGAFIEDSAEVNNFNRQFGRKDNSEYWENLYEKIRGE